MSTTFKGKWHIPRKDEMDEMKRRANFLQLMDYIYSVDSKVIIKAHILKYQNIEFIIDISVKSIDETYFKKLTFKTSDFDDLYFDDTFKKIKEMIEGKKQ